MMNDTPGLVLAGFTGVLLGGVFFGGLWWTVRRGMASGHPALWFVGSFVLRTAITLAGFYSIADDDWSKLLLCLLGFMLARSGVSWLARRKVNTGDTSCT